MCVWAFEIIASIPFVFAEGALQNMDFDLQPQQDEDAVQDYTGRRIARKRADGKINANFSRLQNQLLRRQTSALKDLPLCACAMPCFERVVYERVVCE